MIKKEVLITKTICAKIDWNDTISMTIDIKIARGRKDWLDRKEEGEEKKGEQGETSVRQEPSKMVRFQKMSENYVRHSDSFVRPPRSHT
jgi:hypothetical protein